MAAWALRPDQGDGDGEGLGGEQGAEVEKALVKRSQVVVLADEPSDLEGARLADALVELVTGSGGEAGVPTVVIHADARVLTSDEPSRGRVLSETEDGTPLH